MSVIIRLQNLPWSANALDIRSFFRGLAIPDGGVHIVGGEMGDAFIAFSTDEDARQAMMHDRGKISEVQIRLLLSSRAEMQKVIETARQQSLAMQLQLSTPATVVPQKPQPALTTPQPPVITSNSLHILSSQPLQTNAMGISFDSSRSYTSVSQQQSNNYPTGVIDPSRSSRENARDNRRSTSRDRRRSRSTDRGSGRRRRDRSRTRSRDRKFRRSSRRSRSRDRSHERSRDRSRDRSRERSNRDRDRNGGRSSRKNSKDFDNGFYTQDRGADRRNVLEKSMEKEVPKVSPGVNNAWEVMPTNAYTTSSYAANYAVQAYQSAASAGVVSSLIPQISVKASLNSPTGSDNREATKAVVSDNKAEVSSLSFLNATHLENRPTFAFQNPYTQANLNTNTSARDEKDESKNSFNAYNTVNQTDAFGRNLPKIDNSGNRYEPTNSARFEFSQKKDSNKKVLDEDQSCVKITNMCPSTSYSDIRRFFSGLYIPNNGIKMINDQHGLRMGTAYIRFVRAVNVPKALVRDGTQFKSKKISLVAVSDAEFDSMVDSFKPLRNSRFQNNDNVQNGSPRYGNINRDDEPVREAKTVATSPEKQFSILLVKEIAPHSTQQDVMKMFSSYTILDILMTHRGVNRRDIIAYVKFHRSEEARTAYDDISNHRINQRPVRVVISTEEEFEQAQEKVRIAAEKQMKEQLHLEEIEKRKQAEAEAEAEAAAEAAAVATAAAAAAREEQDDQIHHDDQDDRDNQNEEEEPEENDGMGSDSPQYAIAEQDTDFDQRDENIDVFNNERREFPKPSQQSQLKPSNPFSGIPSLLDIPATVIEPEKNTDPRLRHGRPSRFDNPDANIAAQQQATANKFVIVKNCEYRTTIQAIGEYFVKHCIIPNHIEMLRNHRNQPCGEFIIEFQNSESAAEAVLRNNDRLSIRPIRVSLITPQQIADRMNQPFMNCLPSGDNQQHYQQPNNNNMMMNNQGMRQNFNKMGGNFNNNRNNSGNDHSNDRNVFGPDQSRNQNQNSNFFRGGNNGNHSKGPRDANGPMNMPNNRNRSHIGNPHNPFSDANDQMEIESPPLDDDDDDDGMPEKFQRPGCVVEMENVPYRADLRDIIDFFDGYNILAEDIIRRYNDDGSPTGDARVAFNSETEAKAAYEAKRQKSIFNRTIFLNIL